MSQPTRVWFITGCSTGFGRELAELVLESGWKAVVTAREEKHVADLVKGHEVNALAVSLDVTDAGQIAAAVKAATEKFGTVLPVMRAQKSGHVINITSVAGFIGFNASAYYSASKHAVEGWSDGLAKEVEPLGLHVTCVEPEPFRTDWAGRSLKQTPTRIADYAERAGARLKGTSDGSGKQAGDPRKAAAMMIEITLVKNPPHQLVLGAWGVVASTSASAPSAASSTPGASVAPPRTTMKPPKPRRARRYEPLTKHPRQASVRRTLGAKMA